MAKPLFEGSEWSFAKIDRVYEAIEQIAVEDLKLDTYPNQIEIISSDQMLDCYASIGLPVMYSHWSFGKRFMQDEYAYRKGMQGLAYEIVLNTNPCIAYLMEENSMTMQTLVIAHASFGHNCFSDDTELLTKYGWKRREHVSKGDLIATLNRETRLVEYHPVDEKFEYDYDGDLCHFKNSGADHLVTPNHKMIYTRSYDRAVCEIDAIDWNKTGTNAIVSGVKKDATENESYSDDELRLLMWCVTNGSLEYPPTGYWRFHLKKKRKIARLSALLTRMGFTFSVKEGKYTTKVAVNLDTSKYIKFLPGDFDLSPRQVEIMLSEWMVTDGSVVKLYPDGNPRSGLLFTAIKEHADKIQELAAVSGIKTCARRARSGVYAISVRFHKQDIQLTKSPLTRLVPYSGKVWCVSVQNHTLFARRNGKVLVTGNSYFKNNYMFRQWTDAEGILDYLVFAKKYIAKCEEKHGAAAVERTLDACHALMNHGVDRYRRPSPLSKETAENRQREREEYVQRQANDLWRTLPNRAADDKADTPERFPKEPEENLLYFLEKHSPILEGWQREVVRIVRKIAQYFYPQKQTQVGNEGWASFVHYFIMHRLRDKGLITDGSMLEFLHSHSGVVFQPDFDDKRYSGINPYHLGFGIFSDIKRICEEPTSEDREWFPELAGTDWLSACHDAVANYRDESLIQQFLSPALMRKNKMFLVENRSSEEHMTIEHIHNERGFRAVRNALSRQYSLTKREPDIQVVDANLRGDRTLRLRHMMYDGIRLNKNTHDVLLHLQHLWGYKVEIETVDHATGESAESVVIGNG